MSSKRSKRTPKTVSSKTALRTSDSSASTTRVLSSSSSTWRPRLTNSMLRIAAMALITMVFQQLRSDVKQYHQQVVPYKVVDLPGRGKGMLASHLIKQGERIITEKPLFTVPVSIKMDPVELIESKLNDLDLEGRAAFFNLSHADLKVYPEEVPLSIVQTNGIAAGSDVGIFPRTARLNHGCSFAFNSVYSWRPSEGTLVVHALKEIPEGEELLTTYFDTKRPRDQRREFLLDRYKFRCGCKACSLSSELSRASDERLQKMVALHDQFKSWSSGSIDGLKATQLVNQIWQLGDEEGYWSERGQLAADAAHIAAAHSDERATRQWALIAQEWYSHEVGADSEQVVTMRALVENSRGHYAWGTRERLNVDVPLSN